MSTPKHFFFKLYVAKGSPHSIKAVSNLRELCLRYLPSSHEIEIIDVLADPDRAHQDRILVTPTLVKSAPKPSVRIVGNLSDTELVLNALNLLPVARDD